LFEEADTSTLLLDEVGDLPLALQAKLLRALQEGTIRRVGETRERRVDVRMIAATARDLEAEVAAGQFREDLFYRLNVLRLHVPPLRERPDDIEQLALLILRRISERAGRRVTFAPEVLTALRQRAVVLTAGARIELAALTDTASPGRGSAAGGTPGGTLKGAITAAEEQAIRDALRATGGNRAAAAERLDVGLRTLYYKLRSLGIE
jgi:two-component system response regulator AtoC